MRNYVACLCFAFFIVSMPQASFSANAAITKAEWAELMRDANFKAADQKHREVYKEAMAALSEEDKQVLRAEQRALNAKIEKEAFVKFGKGTPEYTRFLTEAAYARIAELQSYAATRRIAVATVQPNSQKATPAASKQMTLTGTVEIYCEYYRATRNCQVRLHTGQGRPVELGDEFGLPDAVQMCLNNAEKAKQITAVQGLLSTNSDGSSTMDVRKCSSAADPKSAEVQKAAEQGDAEAQITLGGMYQHGYVVPQNYATALQWYQKAADQGNSGVLYTLAYMYRAGQGVAKDDAKARQLEKRALDLSTTTKQATLTGTVGYYNNGVGLEFGLHTEQGQPIRLGFVWELTDPVKECLENAEKAKQTVTVQGLLRTYKDGSGSFMDAKTVECTSTADHQKLVKLQKAAAQGDAEAQFNLAFMYSEGQGVEKDEAKSAKLIQESAKNGYLLAQHVLGTLYEKGVFVPKDEKMAMFWYQKAAEQGDKSALAALDRLASISTSNFDAPNSNFTQIPNNKSKIALLFDVSSSSTTSEVSTEQKFWTLQIVNTSDTNFKLKSIIIKPNAKLAYHEDIMNVTWSRPYKDPREDLPILLPSNNRLFFLCSEIPYEIIIITTNGNIINAKLKYRATPRGFSIPSSYEAQVYYNP
jgi:TPR repeat protein